MGQGSLHQTVGKSLMGEKESGAGASQASPGLGHRAGGLRELGELVDRRQVEDTRVQNRDGRQ